MDILRTILIIVGVLLIAGIYLAEPIKKRWQQYQQRRGQGLDATLDDFDTDETLGLKRRQSEDELPDEWVGQAYISRRDAQLPADALDELKGMRKNQGTVPDDVKLSVDDADDAASLDPADAGPRQPDEVIVMTLMAAQGKRFRGPLLLKSLQDAGLQHGDMDIFHYTPEGQRQALFSVANILEPGHFVMSEIVQMETPGIAMFMQLPASIDGELAWTHMHNRAGQMAESLQATLCDAQRRPLGEEGLLLLQHQASVFKAKR